MVVGLAGFEPATPRSLRKPISRVLQLHNRVAVSMLSYRP